MTFPELRWQERFIDIGYDQKMISGPPTRSMIDSHDLFWVVGVLLIPDIWYVLL